jgi:hypothetical protein
MSYRKLLENADVYTVIRGREGAPRLPDHQWDMFSVDGACAGSDQTDRALELGIEVAWTERGCLETPMVDDEATSGMDVDDLDACDAYLSRGGVLVRLPDEGNPDASRWYPVLHLHTLHARVAAALGWSVEATRAFSLLSLRDIVRPVSPNLAQEITCANGAMSS